MKSTYKLLGVQWDHKSLPCALPIFVQNREIQDYCVERNLFDLNSYERQVRLTEILKTEDEKSVNRIIEKLNECDYVYINVDYVPIYRAKEIIDFYALRILQIYAFMCNSLPNQKVAFMCNEKTREILTAFWRHKVREIE